jgi:hypothetical protein
MHNEGYIVFWDVTMCDFLCFKQYFGGTCYLLLQLFKGGQHFLPKEWCMSTKLHGVTSHKIALFIAPVKASGHCAAKTTPSYQRA